jgi:S-DNA-T family DNA segregation ATPase FtsK/SpoIIIE
MTSGQEEAQGRVLAFRGRTQVEHQDREEEPLEVDAPDSEPEPVDPPPGEDLPVWQRGEVQRRPVLYPALHRDNIRPATTFYLGGATHWLEYHTIRLPEYAAKVVAYAPRGAGRAAAAVASWVTVAEARPLKAAAVRKEDHQTYLHLERATAPKAHARRIVLTAMGGVAVVGVTALWFFTPAWVLIVVLVVATGALGYVGRPIDRPLIGPAVIAPQQQRLTSDAVSRALAATELPALNRKDATVTFPQPIAIDGPGWLAVVDLPYGVTAVEVIERRAKLASGLRRPLGCCWPEQAPEHPGRLMLWVGNEDMRKARQPIWPLRRSGAVDLFRPQPFGTDQRGRWVFITLMFTSVVIGAIPRMGKTFALRELLLIAALDPRVELYAYDNKGTGDLSPLECVAHRYGVGEEEDDLEQELAEMRKLHKELRRRAKVIRELPKHLCPESKVTPQLADQRSYGLYPIVIGVDECQVWFEHPEFGDEFERICTDLVKRGPALGIILILATQRPDAKSLPTGISANASTRYCLKVMGQTENDMVLGTSRYKQGTRATLFAWEDKGIGYLIGEGADGQIVRSAYLDGPISEAVAMRARAMREVAGTLSGHCVGETEERAPTSDILDDLQAVFVTAVRTDRPGAWSEELCFRLAALRPEVYSGWDPDTLAAALRPYALQTGQLNMLGDDGQRYNRRGVRREALEQALAVRAERRSPRAVTGGVE